MKATYFLEYFVNGDGYGDVGPKRQLLLNIVLFVRKQMTSTKKNQKFAGKPQLAYFVFSFTRMTSLKSGYSLIIQNFATS